MTACLIAFAWTAADAAERFPLLKLLGGTPTPSLVCYSSPSLNPNDPGNHARWPTSAASAELAALRPHFDGLILYGHHESSTPRVLAAAKALKFRVVLLAVWNPRSTAELDGMAAEARRYADDFALGVLVGNEGLTFKRYEEADLIFAGERLRKQLPANAALATSEPLHGYKNPAVRNFGDFLAPNIHPAFDRPELSPRDAAAWVHAEAARLAAETGQPVLVKETGFPHGGKAKYTLASQREFWDAYLKPGRCQRTEGGAFRFHGVAFEAFDTPWKAASQNDAIEGAWGMFSSKLKPHPAAALWTAALPK